MAEIAQQVPATHNAIVFRVASDFADRIHAGGIDALAHAITKAIHEAAEAEREACAQTADEARRGGNPEGAADAIRARGSKTVEAADLPLDSERRGMLAKRSVEARESCGLCGFALAFTGPKPVHRIASIPETTHAFRADGSELHVGDVVACGERYREESIGFVHHGIVIETRSP